MANFNNFPLKCCPNVASVTSGFSFSFVLDLIHGWSFLNWLSSNSSTTHFCLLIGANVLSNWSLKASVKYASSLILYFSILDTHTNEKNCNRNNTIRIVDEWVLIVFLQAHNTRKISINRQKQSPKKPMLWFLLLIYVSQMNGAG